MMPEHEQLDLETAANQAKTIARVEDEGQQRIFLPKAMRLLKHHSSLKLKHINKQPLSGGQPIFRQQAKMSALMMKLWALLLKQQPAPAF